MKTTINLFILIYVLCGLGFAFGQTVPTAQGAGIDVEWYPPETEKGRAADRARVIISGRTMADSLIQINGESVTIVNGSSAPNTGKIESRKVRSNFEGFFELALELPQGFAQIPIQVVTKNNKQKIFMISVDVKIVKNSIDDVKYKDTRTSQSKPPAAAKRIRLWAGAGWTYQVYNQDNADSTDLKFSAFQAPGLVVRGGYWGEKWGLDLYFRDAPGKMEVEAPLTVKTPSYHWSTFDAKGLYQMDRGPGSRIGGVPSQWQIRFGSQSHQLPFMIVNASNEITVLDATINTGALGVGLLLGQEQDWTYEFALGYQQPLSSALNNGSFVISPKMAFDLQIGAAYKFAPNWRLGLFSYSQSLEYAYENKSSDGSMRSGVQKLFYTTFDLRLGYEF